MENVHSDHAILDSAVPSGLILQDEQAAVALTMDDNPHSRSAGIIFLAAQSEYESYIHPAIVLCLFDNNAKVRLQAASAIAQNADKAQEAVFELADRAVNDNDIQVQEACCAALGGLGSYGEAALPALIQLLRTGNSRQRVAASAAMANMALHAEMARPALIQALSDEDDTVSNNATKALTEMCAAA